MNRESRFFFLFEQSGTFKVEAKRLGFKSYDVDIVQTHYVDYHIDLFYHIDQAYNLKPSFFDGLTPNDVVFAFFPCTRFSCVSMHWLRGSARQLKSVGDAERIRTAMKYHSELSRNYQLLCMLFLLAERGGFSLIVENPYSLDHYLKSYFPLSPSVVIRDRRRMGDYYVKPTQFFFYNLDVQNNVLLECVDHYPYKRVNNDVCGFDRSLMFPCFASQFLRSYVIPRELWEGFDFYS